VYVSFLASSSSSVRKLHLHRNICYKEVSLETNWATKVSSLLVHVEKRTCCAP